jgi:hypothetical protein
MIKRKQIIFRAMNDETQKNQESGVSDNTENIENIINIENIECSSIATTKRPQKSKRNYTEDGHADVFFDPFGLD